MYAHSGDGVLCEEIMVYLMKPEGLPMCCMWTAAKGDICLCFCVATCLTLTPLIVLTAFDPQDKPLR